MKKTISYLICALSLVACGDDGDLVLPNTQDVVTLAGIDAEVYSGASTRAPALDKDNHVGRSVFVSADQMVLTSIKRTTNPVKKFSYKGIVYDYLVEEGQTSGSWNRDENKGCTEADPNTVPLRIYWTDAASAHTYIGYSLPKPIDTFSWTETDGTYTGKLRSANSTTGETPATFIDHTTNENIIKDDLLLTYDNDKLAEPGGSVAKIYFYHALANVRVIVNISGFSASDQHDDVKSNVHDMVLKEMPIEYQWDQTSAGVTALSNSTTMDTHMWIPRQDGTGTGVGKQFTFYALAVPRKGVTQAISFKVTYPNPMKPDKKLTNTYTTEISGIEYRAGSCTTINITLNHQNEDITVGAEYMDWQYVETPDQSELKKNSTMLTREMLDRSNYTLLGDVKANADDATWLYVDPSTQKILDIYGHDGSSTNPFVIATAQQLVAFANEVKGTDRKAVSYKDLNSADKTLAAGASFDFTGYYVKLDADIVMQPELEVNATSRVTWCGVGDDSHVFNGKFLGGRRTIRCLYGSPFFYKLGSEAVVEQLNFMDVIEVDGRGTIANESRGLIAAVFANGPIRQKEPANKAIYSGSLVGTVEADGAVISCAHFGDVEAWAEGDGVIGGLVGYNQGLLLSCYHSGKEKNLVTGAGTSNTYAGVGKYSEGSNAFSCYYNIDADPEKSDYASLEHGKHAFPVHIDVMQSDNFVNGTDAITVLKDDNNDYNQAHQEWTNQHRSLNNALDIFKQLADENKIPESIRNESHRAWFTANYQSYKFTYTPGEYPRVQ